MKIISICSTERTIIDKIDQKWINYSNTLSSFKQKSIYELQQIPKIKISNIYQNHHRKIII